MGLFDQIIAGVAKSVGQEVEREVLPNLLSKVLGQTSLGSVGGLLEQLQKGGLGGQVASWLGNGANMPVSVDQLRNALGGGPLKQMAEASGTSIDDLLKMLTQHLPGAVDQMSPDGKLVEDAAAGATDESAADDPAADADDRPARGSLAEKAGLNDIEGSGRR